MHHTQPLQRSTWNVSIAHSSALLQHNYKGMLRTLWNSELEGRHHCSPFSLIIIKPELHKHCRAYNSHCCAQSQRKYENTPSQLDLHRQWGVFRVGYAQDDSKQSGGSQLWIPPQVFPGLFFYLSHLLQDVSVNDCNEHSNIQVTFSSICLCSVT